MAFLTLKSLIFFQLKGFIYSHISIFLQKRVSNYILHSSMHETPIKAI